MGSSLSGFNARASGLAALACVLLSPVSLQGRPPERPERRIVNLCTLRAKPGNAHTFVRPEPPRRPEAGVDAGGATFDVTYVGFGGAPQAQAAFQYAVGLWAAAVDSPVPIRIEATFEPLGPGLLGSAGAAASYTDTPNAIPKVFYGDPLADRLAGGDQFPGDFDIYASFSSDTNWYYGTDGNTPAGQYDFVSVVLHELGHGLGFAGQAYIINQGMGDLGGIGGGGFPDVYDLFTVTETGALLLGFPNESLALGAALQQPFNPGNPQGPGVYWNGAAGRAANGGVRPRLYTPAIWLGGSSYSHLDEDVYPEGNANSLMTFQLAAAEAIHSPGPIALGMFDDMGWNGEPNLIANGNFSGGLASWSGYDFGNITHNSAAGGIFEYRRSAPGGPAVILQNTGAAVGAGQQLLASWEMGNSSIQRRRFSVLIHDQDFSDLSVCTFWMPPMAPMLPYQMVTHTTEAWTNATISIYTATDSQDAGNYRLDNVTMREAPTGLATETRCEDPWFPVGQIAPDSVEWLTNGTFGAGLPPWSVANTLTAQVVNGVLEFTRDTSQGLAGVVFQTTGRAPTFHQIVSATFQLGNSSNVRKRVTVLLQDADFSDLHACTFWIPPGQALSPYVMRAFVTEASWANAQISFFAATVGTEQATRVDNVSMKHTQADQTWGTECGEPGGPLVAGRVAGGFPDSANTQAVATSSSRNAPRRVLRASAPRSSPVAAAPAVPRVMDRSLGWSITVMGSGTETLAEVQVSTDGVTWRRVAIVPVPPQGARIDVEPDPTDPAPMLVRLVVHDTPGGRPRIFHIRDPDRP